MFYVRIRTRKIAFRKLGCETSRTSRSSSFLTSRYQALAARGLSRHRCRSPGRGRQGSDPSASSSWPSSAYQVKDFLRLPGRSLSRCSCCSTLRVQHASSTAIAHLRASTRLTHIPTPPSTHPYPSKRHALRRCTVSLRNTSSNGARHVPTAQDADVRPPGV